MIIGNGAIASVLTDRPDRLYFVSGVSNSKEDRESEYQREKDLLAKQRRDLQIIYISTLGVFNGETRYFKHKREMELLIKGFPHHAILRIGNITWKNDNPNTIINRFKCQIKNGDEIVLIHPEEYRYLVDKDEFLYWLNLIPSWNVEMNIPGERVTLKEIVEKIKKGIL